MIFDICEIKKLFDIILENYISLLIGQLTIFGVLSASYQFLSEYQKHDQRSNFYLGYDVFELELKDNIKVLRFAKSKLFLFFILIEIISIPLIIVTDFISQDIINIIMSIDIAIIVLYFVLMFLLLFQISKYVLGMNKTKNMIPIKLIVKTNEKFLKENNFLKLQEVNSKSFLNIANEIKRVIVWDDNKNQTKQEQIYYNKLIIKVLNCYYNKKLYLNKDNSATVGGKAKKVFNKSTEVEAIMVIVRNYSEKIEENNIHTFIELIINIVLSNFYYLADDFNLTILTNKCCEIIDCLYQNNNIISKKEIIKCLFANMNNYENEMVEIFCTNKIKNLICKELYNCFEGKESFENFISVYDIINRDRNLRDHLCAEISEKMVSYNLVDVKDLMGILEVNERFYIFSYLIISYSVYKFRYNWEYINTNNLKTLFSIYNLDKIDVGYVSERLMCSNISHRINNNVINELIYYIENSLTKKLMLQIKHNKYYDLFYMIIVKCCVLGQRDYLDEFTSIFTIDELLSLLNEFSIHKEVICNDNLSIFLYQIRELIIPQLSNSNIQYKIFDSINKMIILDFDLKKEYFNTKSIFLNSDDFGKYVLLKLDNCNMEWPEIENSIKHSFAMSNMSSEDYVEYLSAISSDLGHSKSLYQKKIMKKYLDIHFS